MALEQKLSLKLSQKLVMTPSLQQAIKLLQMTRLELEGVLTQELVENPVLEEREISVEDEKTDEPEEKNDELEEALSDIDIEAYFNELETWEGTGQPSTYEHREGPPLENTLSRDDDLYDHLQWQLQMIDVPPLIREIAELIIGNLEPDGFLGATVEEIMAMGGDDFHVSRTPDEVRAAREEAERRAEAEAADAKAAEAEAAEAATAEVNTAMATPSEAAPAEARAAGVAPFDAQTLVAADAVPRPSAGIAVSPPPAHVPEAVAHAGASQPVSLDGEPLDGGLTSKDGASPDGAEPAGYPREAVEQALELVRNFDPPGVACRDLREALLRQLERGGEPEDSLAARLVAEKWDLFRKRKFEQIAKDFEVPLQDLKPAVELIARLETRPGRKYDTDETRYVEPDVHIVKVGGEYVVQLNDNGLPRLRVSRAYRRMLAAMRREGKQAEAQQYIKEKMRSAMWLIKSLDQRQRTIYKVATSIVKQQRGFLDHGVEHLVPMVLRDVAEDIEMHESTVSRVVSNKYMHTPRGLLPMKFFFHSGIDREYGGDISSLTVKRKIEKLIEAEDPKKPLSDSALMRVLKREGIQIARRTVAKYRDELGIPSSTDRKKIF